MEISSRLQQVLAPASWAVWSPWSRVSIAIVPACAPKPWQEKNLPGNGLLYDLGAHLADQVLMLFGTPESIFADVRYDRDVTVVNDAFTHPPLLSADARAG